MSQSKNKQKKHTEIFQSFNIIVFGGDGDLALRKIFPAIFHREQDGQLLCPYNIVAITRNKPEETKFSEELIRFLKLTAEEHTTEDSILAFAKKVKLIQAADASVALYQDLANYLNQFPDYQNIYYFSTPSSAFGPIAQTLKEAGLVNLFTVFAKIDDDKNLTAFLVDADSEGISLNAEEKKMGIKGSSTRQVFFNNVKVPVENMLSTRENGFKIALNILNIGRIKLAAGVMGGAKGTINETVKYANEREQFGRSISKYGAIRFKLAEQVIRTYVVESATYRAGQNIDDAIAAYIASGMDKGAATLKGIEDFAPECAVLKVAGSECLDYVVDEAVQVYGGMGYSAESTVERAYRDARINRIFEGTNEINRMLTVDMMLRRAMKGELDLMGPAMKVAGELMSIPPMQDPVTTPLGNEERYIEGFKKCILMVAGSAVQKLMQTLSKEQEVLMNIADIAIWTYQAESVLLRVQKKIARVGEEASAVDIAICRTYFYDIADKINKAAKDAIYSFAEGDEVRMMTMGLKRFTKTEVYNHKEARQLIAQKLINDGRYNF